MNDEAYEAATNRLYQQKVKMSTSVEMDIFYENWDFNPVFYAETIAGVICQTSCLLTYPWKHGKKRCQLEGGLAADLQMGRNERDGGI